MPDKVTRWLMFTLVLSLAPIGASWIWAAASSAEPVSLYSVVRQGDLYLLAASFSAVGIGELIGIKKKGLNFMIFLGGTSALNIMLSVFLYGLLRNTQSLPNEYFVVMTSFVLFLVGCAVSTSCVAISEMKDA